MREEKTRLGAAMSGNGQDRGMYARMVRVQLVPFLKAGLILWDVERVPKTASVERGRIRQTVLYSEATPNTARVWIECVTSPATA